MAEEMEKENWIKSAVPNEETKDIIVTTTDGYIYQVYYDEETGKKEINYIGKEDGKEIPTINASYDKIKAEITAEAKCKGGIKEIQLIYKKEVVQTQLGETAKFPVQKTGWYEIKAIANNGKTIRTWVRVASTVIAPLIEVVSNGEQENDWYGKDDKPVQVRISTDNETAERVYYKTNKDTDFTMIEGKEASLTIIEAGRTIIYAYITDNYGNESEQGNKEIKYDNIHPEVGELEIEGTKGTIDETETGWYTSEEVILKLKNMTDEPTESGVVGYYYWEIPEGTNPNDITEEQKTYVKGSTGEIKITKEGKVAVGIEARDKAGNITEGTNTIIIQKDSVKPIEFLPSIVEGSITEEGFTVTAGTTDETSEISHYNFYIEKGTEIVKESKNNEIGRFEVTGLNGETTYNIVVEAVDKAGNVRTGTGITATTLIANTPPYFSEKLSVNKSWDFTTKTTSFEVKSKANDNEGDKLTYKLYIKTSEESIYTYVKTNTEEANVETIFNVNKYNDEDLESDKTYDLKIEVSDGKEIIKDTNMAQISIKTYCKTTWCDGRN